MPSRVGAFDLRKLRSVSNRVKSHEIVQRQRDDGGVIVPFHLILTFFFCAKKKGIFSVFPDLYRVSFLTL